MRVGNVRKRFARGLVAVVVVMTMLFSGLGPAGAVFTIFHTEYAPHHWIPAETVEAEDWIRAGMQVDPASVGDGEQLAQVHDEDWAEYNVGSGYSTGGSERYVVTARVASAGAGGTIEMSIDGLPIGSIDVDGTGGWEVWTTISAVVDIPNASEKLTLTFAGDDTAGPLLSVDWLDFEYEAIVNPPALSPTQRVDAIDELVTALESYAVRNGTFRVAGAGSNGGGQGWAFYQGGTYQRSIARTLIINGHLSPVPLHDELWTDTGSIAGDVLVYLCKDRAAVFTREGTGQPSAEDREWWDSNGCNRYPIDRLGVSYYALAEPVPASETLRQEAVDEFVAALESYGAEHGTYQVAGAGNDGNGQGWVFYEGDRYPTSLAKALIAGGHLDEDHLHDDLWRNQYSIAGDALLYRCADRVAVFTREGSGEPSAEDRNWWDTNGCRRYPIDQLGVSYFAVSAPLGN